MSLTINPQLSPLVVGFWRLKQWQKNLTQLQGFVEQALELGLYSMDHAYVYGSEAPFGKMLKQAPHLRERMQIITKCGINAPGFSDSQLSPLFADKTAHYRSDRAAIINSVEHSLQALQTDYLDVVMLHRPDYLMNFQQIASAFTQLQQQGKVKHFAVSNFSLAQQQALQAQLAQPLLCNQVQLSPYHCDLLDSGLIEYTQQHQLALMAWSPLAGGQLFNADDKKAVRLLSCLQKIQHQIGAECASQVAYVWLKTLPIAIHPIIGTGDEQRLAQAAASEQYSLSHEQWYEILQASRGHPVA